MVNERGRILRRCEDNHKLYYLDNLILMNLLPFSVLNDWFVHITMMDIDLDIVLFCRILDCLFVGAELFNLLFEYIFQIIL